MKIFQLVLIMCFAPCAQSLAQTSPYDDCWKCILAAEKKNDQQVMETCRKFIADHPTSKSIQVAQFLLGTAYIKTGEYSKGRELLNEIHTTNGMFMAYTEMLIGDTYSEQGEIEKALMAYENAAKADVNSLTSPQALFKAMLHAKFLGNQEKVQSYLLTVRSQFEEYFAANGLERYLDKTISTDAFPLPEEESVEQPSRYGYGTIYGKQVNAESYIQAVEDHYASALDTEEKSDIYHLQKLKEIWEYQAKKLLLNKEGGELGLIVTEEEFYSYLYGENGFGVLPDFEYAFVNEQTGAFDRDLLKMRVAELRDVDEKALNDMWRTTKTYYSNRRLHEKLTSVFAYGSYVTNSEVEHERQEQLNVRYISYIRLPYSDIPDDSIVLAEDELRNRYERNKKSGEYINEEDYRTFVQLRFDLLPTKEDSLAIWKELEELKVVFQATDKDSLFVMSTSDVKAFSSSHLFTFKPDDEPDAREGMTYPKEMKNEMRTAKIGDVLGPYLDGDQYRIVKKLGVNENMITARHVLIAASRNDQEALFKAKLKVDEIMKEINHENFEEFVSKYSEDPGSNSRGGSYTFLDYEMVPEFGKFAVEEEIGKIGVVQTAFGFHIMEVVKREPVNFPVLAVVCKDIKVSAETINNAQNSAEKIIEQVKDRINQQPITSLRKELEELEAENNMLQISVRVNDNSPIIYGFDSLNSVAVLRFIYNDSIKVGDIINQPLIEGDRYLIAVFTGQFPKGEVMPYHEVEDYIRHELIDEKKIDLLVQKVDTTLSLEQIEKSTGLNERNAKLRMSELTFDGKLFEPSVIGAVFREDESDKGTNTYIGLSGIYRIKIDYSNLEKSDLTSEDYRQAILETRLKYFHKNHVKALRKKATLVNNAILHYYGIRK